jgi:serine/threonine protein kinase
MSEQRSDNETQPFDPEKLNQADLDPTLSPNLDFPGDSTPSSIPSDIRTLLNPPSQTGELCRLESYSIRTVLGIGGMGVVLAAWDETLRRPVAIKMMKPQIASVAGSRERFLREARMLANLTHENIVPIFHVQAPNQDVGVPYIVMPLLPGETLESRLNRGPNLSIPELHQIALEVARGLLFAHEAGIIHRDIKPGNIWLERLRQDDDAIASTGFRVRILDFGLARDQHSDTMTKSGAFLGTAAYASPEQIEGYRLDHRSDLFSLGTMLYRATTGKMPFEGPGLMSLMRAVCEHTPTPIDQLRPELPSYFKTLIDKLLQKNPANRPASAREILRILNASSAEVAIAPEGKQSSGKADRKRQPWLLRLPKLGCQITVTIALALLGGGVIVYLATENSGTGVAINNTTIPTETSGGSTPPTKTLEKLPPIEPSSPKTPTEFSSADLARTFSTFIEMKYAKYVQIDKANRLYSESLRNLISSQTITKDLTVADRELLPNLLLEIGQHMLSDSLVWNSVASIQEDKLLAETVAQQLFERSISLGQTGDVLAWLEMAKLLQPNAKVLESTSEAARGKNYASKLLTLLIDRANTRYEGTREVDLKITVLAHRKIHENFTVLLSGELTPIVAKLATKWAILQGLQLAEIDNSSYFRQEKILKQVGIWTSRLGATADELFLSGRYSEVVSRVLKPANRFSLKDTGISYQTAIQTYSRVQELVGQKSPELKLAEARNTYWWEFDKQARTDVETLPVNARVFVETENKLKEAIEQFAALNQSGNLAEANLWFGRIHLLSTTDKAMSSEDAFSRYSSAANSFELGINAAETLDGGAWMDSLLGGLLKARETDAKFAFSVNLNVGTKIRIYSKAYESLNARTGRAGIKANAFLVHRQLEASEERGVLAKISTRDLIETIARIPSDGMTNQDAESLASLLSQLGVKSLEIAGYATPEQRVKTREAIISSTRTWARAYRLFDDYPFQPASLKANTAGTLGKWYRFLGDVFEMDQKTDEAREAFAKAIPVLGWSLTCTPLIDDYWAYEVHYGYSLAMFHITPLNKADEDFTPKRLAQLLGLAEAVKVLGDADQRIRGSNMVRDELTKGDLARLKSTIYPKFREFIKARLAEVNDLTEFQKAACYVSLAEMELSPDAKGNIEKGKQLAKEWLPELETMLQRNTITLSERYQADYNWEALLNMLQRDTITLSERYLLQRQVDRVNLMVK